jgi:glycine betaine/choline ABC-type transport system substrate-binding protein
VKAIAWAALFLAFLPIAARADALPPVRIGSKAFPESWILGDALAALVTETRAAAPEQKKNLGGTEIA